MKKSVCCTILTGMLALGAVGTAFAQESDSLTVRVIDVTGEHPKPIINADIYLYNENDDPVAVGTTDDDGYIGFGMSALSSVEAGAVAGARLHEAAPNPFIDRTTVNFSVGRAGEITAGIYDPIGRLVAGTATHVEAGAHAFDLDLSALPGGVYFLQVRMGDQRIGTTRLAHTGGGGSGEVSIRMRRSAGNSALFEKSSSVPGQFRIVVMKAGYDPAEVENIVIEGEVREDVEMVLPAFGRAETRDFAVIGTSADGLDVVRDLAFNPDNPDELWTVNRTFDGTVTYYYPGTEKQWADRRRDYYANHFMEEVSAIAMGDNGNFGTVQETRNTYDNQAPPNDFMGPTLWPLDTSIYARVNQGNNQLLGSHMDMLHESPYGMGMAHDYDNVYWVFDGYYESLMRYDFGEDHGPGGDDHADGIVRRYVEVELKREPNVPSHMILDKESGWLYINDTGNRRILRVDTESGQVTGPLYFPNFEPLAEHSKVEGVTFEEIVTDNGNLDEPCGIALLKGALFVTDHATGEIIAFTLEGEELGRIQTPAKAIMGITAGPDGKLWYVDAEANEVIRIDP